MNRARSVLLLLLCLAGLALLLRPARSAVDRGGVPTWENEPEFKKDVFSFVRIRYSGGGYGGWRWGGGSGDWTTDYPDAELNLLWRLQQMTSLKVNPEPVTLEITDKQLFDYPFIYIVEPGDLRFTEEEVKVLRQYLLNGGFLMVDDFWGERQWNNFHREIKRVFPDREVADVPLEHPIFHCVFDLKERPQIPAIGWALRGRAYGITWEYHDGEQCREVHYRAIYDDQGRMMVFICHNTDLGDSWEREGEDEWFFREFAEKKGYPMGINILFYAMTH
jgi:hypothetical protein